MFSDPAMSTRMLGWFCMQSAPLAHGCLELIHQALAELWQYLWIGLFRYTVGVMAVQSKIVSIPDT